MLFDVCDLRDITYKGTKDYINFLYMNHSWKWLCRLALNNDKIILYLPGREKGKMVKYPLTDVYDLQQYSAEMHEIVQRYKDSKK